MRVLLGYRRRLAELTPSVDGLRVLDVGCGEGKNSTFLAERGAWVLAMDVSALALRNAASAWRNANRISWIRGDVRECAFGEKSFDIVIAYGLLHCLASEDELRLVVRRLQSTVAVGGYHVVCAINDRLPIDRAHEGMRPTLVPHEGICGLYANWDLIASSDSDLHEVHPHNLIPHVHSMTRLIARRVG